MKEQKSDIDHEDTEKYISRRPLLQAIGTGALLGIGSIQVTGPASASDDSDQIIPEHVEYSELSPRRAGQLRGEVMSSRAFKTIRREIRKMGFRPDFGDGAVSLEFTDTQSGQSWEAFKVDCPARDENTARNALLFARKGNGKIRVRGIGKDDDDMHICDCSSEIGDNGSSDRESMTHFVIPSTRGGD